MKFVKIKKEEGIATAVLSRGKVNALNETVIDELTDGFRRLAEDGDTRAVILTGEGKFFTFGFDIPEFLQYPRESFVRYLTKFTDLYTDIFLFPKPVIAALNGHTIAGGCMLAISCDYRLMVPGKAKISLNEINFGSSLFAGSVEMMKFWVGTRYAERAVCTGEMYGADEALRMGLIDQIVSPEELYAEANKVARYYSGKDGAAFRSIKYLVRKSLADDFMGKERESISEFVDIWYSENTWKNLQDKVIHG
ncbi:MAG: enoyl-CoA hydratase/isomerase family protein [Deltaproteobacteria bacterium]|nr:enoyl-CoA hydratase/isomerase family protein [Deltaproteobacteria bacterium]MBN2688556.1 enoyl-CoA hydratase/isomerase family protein [Deltaproteobacteria bacterium]